MNTKTIIIAVLFLFAVVFGFFTSHNAKPQNTPAPKNPPQQTARSASAKNSLQDFLRDEDQYPYLMAFQRRFSQNEYSAITSNFFNMPPEEAIALKNEYIAQKIASGDYERTQAWLEKIKNIPFDQIITTKKIDLTAMGYDIIDLRDFLQSKHQLNNIIESSVRIFSKNEIRTNELQNFAYQYAIIGNPEAADKWANRALELADKNDQHTNYLHSGLGWSYFNANEPEKALQHWQKANEISGGEKFNDKYTLALGYYGVGDEEAALQAFDQAIRRDPRLGGDFETYQKRTSFYKPREKQAFDYLYTAWQTRKNEFEPLPTTQNPSAPVIQPQQLFTK